MPRRKRTRVSVQHPEVLDRRGERRVIVARQVGRPWKRLEVPYEPLDFVFAWLAAHRYHLPRRGPNHSPLSSSSGLHERELPES